MTKPLRVRHLGLQPYEPMLQAMQAFTDSRNSDTMDEIWLLQHEPVFTQGQAGKAAHVLQALMTIWWQQLLGRSTQVGAACAKLEHC